MSGALKAKIIVVVVLLALTAALVGTCIAYRNRACEHTSLEHIEAVEPTCTESGNIEHWACKRCGATFKDESGAEEIGRVVRTALGHDLTRHSAVEPTCTEAGNVEYWECERCGVIFADSAATKPLDDNIVAASGHDWNEPVWNWSDDYFKATAYFVCNKDSEHVESVTAKVTISSSSATCTGSGGITYLAKAELDGKTYSDSEVVQSGALGHDWTVSEWTWADDHTSVTAKFVCSRDPSHTHELTETEIVIDEDPATCLADGKTEYSVEIAFDGNTYSDTAVVTHPATGHNWSAPEWTWSGNYSEATATFTCLNDPSHTETVNAVVSILSSSATCTEPGNTEYKAELSFNGNVYTDSQSVSNEALGHDWAVSEWIWSDDHTSVTANFVCARDPSHTHEVTETEIVINEVTATCEKEGKTEYSVEIAFDENKYSDTAVVTHPATGHNWGEPEWTWSEVSSEATATAKFTCLNDPSHTETLAAEVTIVDTTATCTAPGETGFMAKVTFNGKDYTDKQTVTGEALGHAWAASEWIWSDDYTSVTAKFVCSRDNSHTRAVSGQINEDVIKPVSCTEDGESTFTATVSLDDETYTDQKASVVVKAKGHVLSKNWSFDDVYHWHECTVCGENPDLSTHELVDFTCSVCHQTIIYTEGLKYTLSDDGASYLVSGIGTATDRDIKIKPRYEGKPVTGIADNAFKGNTGIKSVLIPDGVESIGAYAFYGCGYLTKVVIPGSVKSIDSYAFDNCRRITRVDYSGDISGWLNIEGLDDLMYYVSSSCELYIGGVKVEGNIDIPEGVTSIPGSAFIYQKGITSVKIPDSVTSIGYGAFKNCSGLQSVTIGNGVTSIEFWAFQNCNDITTVDYWGDISGWLNISGLDDLMDYVSSSCELYIDDTKVEGNIIIPEGVTSIPGSAFRYQTGITSVTIPDSVTSIGNSAFYNCSELKSVTIGNGVTSIGNAAFSGCRGLQSVTIGNDVTSIGQFAFQNCSGLTSVTIPDSVTSIGYSAFLGCSGLQSVTIGTGVTSIESWAFSGCSGITRIYYSGDIKGWLNIEGLDNLMEDVSSSCDLYIGGTKVEGNIVIPDGVTSIAGSAFRNLQGITSVTIPDSVTSIGRSAFEGCINLIQKVDGVGYVDKWVVDCDSSVTAANIRNDTIGIADYAFYDCTTLKSVTIPDSVTIIGEDAFRNCSGLQTVTIGNGVTSIGDYAFSGCTALSTLKWNAVNVSGFNSPNYVFSGAGTGGNGISVTFGDSVESIPYNLFNTESYTTYPKIAGIKVGNNVKSIGFNAFRSVSSVSSVIIPVSVESIGGYAFNDIDTIYCEAQIKPTYWNDYWADSSINVIWGYNNQDSGEFSYVVKDNKAYITKYKGSGTEVTIPDTLSGYKVVSFGEIFKNNTKITKVVIGNNVTSVFPYAFYGCSGLTSLTIPDSVTSIGDWAFYNCGGLQSVTLGNGVESIGGSAFYSCHKITRIDYSGDITGWLNIEGLNSLMSYVSSSCELYISGTKVEELVIPDGVTSIPSYAFRNLTGITSVTIPDSVTSIGSSAFSGCSGITRVDYSGDISGWLNISGLYNLMNYVSSSCELYISGTKVEELVIPDGVTSIPSYAFQNLTGITSVTIPDSVTSIGVYAFDNCSSLTSVRIPDSVTSIGYSAFSGCSGLQSVTIGNGVKSIGSYAFRNCSSLTSIIIPDSVTSIDWNAFSGCSGLKTVTIGNGVTSIGEFAFKNFSSLQSVTIGNGVTSIGRYAFSGCSGLQSVTIGNGVKSIGDDAFENCRSLTEVTIPDSVTSIGWDAFEGCRSLTEVTIPDSVTSIGRYAFSGCSGLKSVTIGNGVTSIGWYAFQNCNGITRIDYSGDISGWLNIEGLNYLMEYVSRSCELYIGGTKVEGDIIIPEGVTFIPSYAFRYQTGITSVTIPDSVTSIGSYAFYNCSSLTSVTIGNGVTSIGYWAFYGCSSLTSVTIPDSVTSIGQYAFCDCSGLQSVTIGNGVTRIEDYAFYGCSDLTSATFKNTLVWKAGRDISLSPVDLADKSTAAQYLSSTYVSTIWSRS